MGGVCEMRWKFLFINRVGRRAQCEMRNACDIDAPVVAVLEEGEELKVNDICRHGSRGGVASSVVQCCCRA
jgi:hypothetical protein